MYLMQALIFCAVVGSNIHWQWTPNQYLASGIGVGLSWIATMAIVEFQDSGGPPQIAQVRRWETAGRKSSVVFGTKPSTSSDKNGSSTVIDKLIKAVSDIHQNKQLDEPTIQKLLVLLSCIERLSDDLLAGAKTP
jgi:hypothetical protein